VRRWDLKPKFDFAEEKRVDNHELGNWRISEEDGAE
jgi:hypothetical protein